MNGPQAGPNVVIIGDFLRDLDDEHTLCVAASLHRQGAITLLCVIGNLAPARLRARGAKGTLQQLGLGAIPVGIGAPVVEEQLHPHETEVPYLAADSEVEEDAKGLLSRTLRSAGHKSTILVLQSGLTDARDLLASYPELCRHALRSIAIMGGVETDGNTLKLDQAHQLTPNNAHNNEFDRRAAEYVYREAQELGIPLVITTRESAYACQIPFQLYDQLLETGNPIGACLKGRQQSALQKLWEAACSPSGDSSRGTLPADRNRAWFVNVFCGGADPEIANGADIWPYVQGFNLYDPVNLVAAVPELRRRFFEPTTVWVRGTMHTVVGVSREFHGVRDAEGLRQFLVNAELDSLRSIDSPHVA